MRKRSLNKMFLIGCLGADPELRYTPSAGIAGQRVNQRESLW